jgi:hypothetical protein
MNYVKLRIQVNQLWKCHRHGVDLPPLDKVWLQEQVFKTLSEVSDKNARELFKHLAFDFRLDILDDVQFTDWLDFARDYGFAVKDNEPSEP